MPRYAIWLNSSCLFRSFFLCSVFRYNFKCLCTGERGRGELNLQPLSLKGCAVFRAIRGELVQSGDMVSQDGLGGESVYGGTFEDENLDGCARHDAPGLLSMANEGTSVRGCGASLCGGAVRVCAGCGASLCGV